MGRDKARYDDLYGKAKPQPVALHHLGLLNLGNSCFYNSILQSLSVCRPLEALIADPPNSSPSLSAASPASPSFSHEPTLSPIPITIALLDILARLSPEVPVANSKALNPKALLKQLSLKHEEYADASQQDAHELLLHLLDGVQMEEIDLIKKISPPRLKLTKQQRRLTVRKDESAAQESSTLAVGAADGASTAAIQVEEEVITDSSDSDSSSDDETEDESRIHPHVHANGSHDGGDGTNAKGKEKMRPFVETTFGGKLAGFIVCDTCQAVSLTHEDFLDISLSLKDDEGNRSRRRDRIKKTLGGGFFSSKKSTGISPVRAVTSQSEAEASTESEVDGHTDSERSANSSNLFRRKSLDPGALNDARRPFWSTKSTSRDPSPASITRQSSSLGKASGATAMKPQIPKPTAEQQAYNRKVLAEIPGPVLAALPPQLRWSIPGGPSCATPSSSVTPAPVVRTMSNLSIQDRNVDQTTTDLYDCFRQFTAVEILADSNAFACRNCWKLLNPGLVEKRRAEKKRRRGARKGGRKLDAGVDSGFLPPPPPLSSQPSLSSVGGESIETSTGNVTDDEATEATPSVRESDADAGDEGDIDSPSASRRSSAVKLPLTIANVLALTPPTPPLSPSGSKPSSSIATTSKLSAPTNGSVSFSSTRPSFSSLPPPHPTSRPPPRAARHVLRRAQKRFLIDASGLPPVLVVHFKRFRNTTKSSLFGTAFMNLKKRDDDLTFPERLDLTPFLAPVQRAPPKSGSRERREREVEVESNGDGSNGDGLQERAGYRLVSVIVHVGTLAMGHYISYCLSSKYSEILSARGSGGLNKEEPEKGEDETEKGATVPRVRRWVYCSDDEVRVCETEEVLRSKAYILFYEKIVH